MSPATLMSCPSRNQGHGSVEMEFEFYTSDISSLFSIVCVAYELSGNGIGEANKSFKVFPCRYQLVSN